MYNPELDKHRACVDRRGTVPRIVRCSTLLCKRRTALKANHTRQETGMMCNIQSMSWQIKVLAEISYCPKPRRGKRTGHGFDGYIRKESLVTCLCQNYFGVLLVASIPSSSIYARPHLVAFLDTHPASMDRECVTVVLQSALYHLLRLHPHCLVVAVRLLQTNATKHWLEKNSVRRFPGVREL